MEAAKNALTIRYSLLPYLYTNFFFAAKDGQTVARPLFFEFPNDNNTYGEISESQFMWGNAFLVIPVIKPKEREVLAYFPSGVWFPYSLDLNEKKIESKGQFIKLDAPLTKVNTAIRGGHVVPILPPKQTTTEMRKEKFSLIVALNEKSTAFGHLYWDDGDSLDPIESQSYSLISFNIKNGTLVSEVVHHKYEGPVVVDNVFVLGLKSKPNSVSVNGKPVSFKYDSDLEQLLFGGMSLSLVESKNTIVWK